MFAQQFTRIPHFLHSLQDDKCVREKREIERQWQQGWGGAEVQALGDSGMSQHCIEPDHNAIWKPGSVAVIVLLLWTWNLPQNLVINTMPPEADVQLREETISDGV